MAFEYDIIRAARLVPAIGAIPNRPRLCIATVSGSEAQWLRLHLWGEPRRRTPARTLVRVHRRSHGLTSPCDHWAAHYARCHREQLDVVHLPFIHYNTIGRGNKTLVNGPIARKRAIGLATISLIYGLITSLITRRSQKTFRTARA